MVELDYDKVLEELINQAKNPDSNQFPEILEQYLENIAKTGDTIFPWSKVKPFIRKKMEVVMENFHQKYPLNDAQVRVPNCDPFDYDCIKMNILQSLDWFCAAPFTIQRLCELLIEPYRHYSRTDKFMRGIEKNVIVVSTIQPQPNKYSTPETIEKQPTFRDLYPQFSLSRSRSSSISSMLNRSPPPNSSSSSSSSSSASTSPSQTSNANNVNINSLMTNGFDNNNHHMMHHHHHHHHHHNNHPHHQPQHLHNNGPFEGSYSLAHLTNSTTNNSPPPSFYSEGTSNGTNLQQQQNSSSMNNTSLNHYNTGATLSSGTNTPNNSATSLSAPLQQLDSFTSVFVASNYLTNQINNHTTSAPSNNGVQRPRNSDWSTPNHHQISSSESLAGDENENIIVDDDYEQPQTGNGDSMNIYQNRSAANIIANNHHNNSILNVQTLNHTSLVRSPDNSITGDENGNNVKEQPIIDSTDVSSDIIKNQGDKKQESEGDNDQSHAKPDDESNQKFDHLISTNSEKPSSREDMDKAINYEDNSINKIVVENEEMIQQQKDENLCLLAPNKKFKLIDEEQKLKIENSVEQMIKNEIEHCSSSDEQLIEEKDQIIKVEQEDLPMDMSGANIITNIDDDINNDPMEQDEKMIIKDDDDDEDDEDDEVMVVVGSQPMTVELLVNINNDNEDQIMSEPMEQE